MLKKVVCLIVVAVILPLGLAAGAESSSSLLEKGIYTEETVGDLDAAIKIYEKIIDEGKANRRFVAQAQFRRGQCLLKQGNKEEAEKAFSELVNQFKDSPNQKKLVEKARKLLPWKSELELEPVPWVDGEHLEIRIKLGGGLDIGNMILSAQSGKVKGREVWHLGLNQNIAANAPNLRFSDVVIDRETMYPIHGCIDFGWRYRQASGANIRSGICAAGCR
jgi:tetratricopeptide (TPR) repeat protein